MGHGVSINPIAFLVVQPDGVRLLPVNYASAVDKLLDYVPDLMDKVNTMVNKCLKDSKTETKQQENTSIRAKEERKRERVEPEEKQTKTKPKRARTTNKQQNSQMNNITTEYEYDETTQEELRKYPRLYKLQ